MEIGLRVKTGFFDTKPYRFLIEDERVLFSPAEEDGEAYAFRKGEVLCVTLKERPLALELVTASSVVAGALVEGSDILEVKNYIQTRLDTKIICEFEGVAG